MSVSCLSGSRGKSFSPLRRHSRLTVFLQNHTHWMTWSLCCTSLNSYTRATSRGGRVRYQMKKIMKSLRKKGVRGSQKTPRWRNSLLTPEIAGETPSPTSYDIRLAMHAAPALATRRITSTFNVYCKMPQNELSVDTAAHPPPQLALYEFKMTASPSLHLQSLNPYPDTCAFSLEDTFVFTAPSQPLTAAAILALAATFAGCLAPVI